MVWHWVRSSIYSPPSIHFAHNTSGVAGMNSGNDFWLWPSTCTIAVGIENWKWDLEVWSHPAPMPGTWLGAHESICGWYTHPTLDLRVSIKRVMWKDWRHSWIIRCNEKTPPSFTVLLKLLVLLALPLIYSWDTREQQHLIYRCWISGRILQASKSNLDASWLKILLRQKGSNTNHRVYQDRGSLGFLGLYALFLAVQRNSLADV